MAPEAGEGCGMQWKILWVGIVSEEDAPFVHICIEARGYMQT
jgi:hypothetical protein